MSIFFKDETADNFYIILKGSVNVLIKKTHEDIIHTISLYKKQYEEHIKNKKIHRQSKENHDEEYKSN